MTIVQLFASPFFGGPERQMLGLSAALPSQFRTVFVSFSNRGLCRPFLDRVREHGFEAIELKSDFPHLPATVHEVAKVLRQLDADIVCCNGYKPDIIGLLAARHAGVPAVSISHGWTAAGWRVRLYETIDRLVLRGMDAVIGVSGAQAERVRRAGAPPGRIYVIRNAINPEAFDNPDPHYRSLLVGYFKQPRKVVIASAGRLSPEKGFENLVAAAAQIVPQHPEVGFVVFGAGPLQEQLQQQIVAAGLQNDFILAGFRADIEKFLPHFDVAVLPSYTEGLPVFVLEALAARVPVVATAVGGTPEVVDDGRSGLLVPAGQPAQLANALTKMIADKSARERMGQFGRERIEREFTFAAQGEQYGALFENLVSRERKEPAIAVRTDKPVLYAPSSQP